MWLTLATLALAQESPLDLDAALALALRDGVDAQEAAFATRAAVSTLRRQRQAGEPTLTLSGSGGVEFSAAGAAPTSSLALSSVTPLYAGGAIRAEKQAAIAGYDAAEAAEARVRQTLHLGLADALLDLAEARARATSAASTLVAEEALATRIETLVRAGTRTRADALQQSASAAKARSAQIDAARDVAQAELALERVLRLDPARPWDFRPPAVGPDLAGDTLTLIAQARVSRPELAAARAELRGAEAEVLGADASGRPSVDLVLGASTRLGDGSDVGAALGDNAGGSAVVQASVPIFNRGVSRDSVTQAQVKRDAAQLTLDAAVEAVGYEVRSAMVDRDAARSATAAAEARWAASDAAASVVSDRYDAGAATFAELLAARATLAEADQARIAAHTTLQRSLFALAWAVGAL